MLINPLSAAFFLNRHHELRCHISAAALHRASLLAAGQVRRVSLPGAAFPEPPHEPAPAAPGASTQAQLDVFPAAGRLQLDDSQRFKVCFYLLLQ